MHVVILKILKLSEKKKKKDGKPIQNNLGFRNEISQIIQQLLRILRNKIKKNSLNEFSE